MHVQKGKVLCESPAALQVAACAKPQSSFAPHFTPEEFHGRVDTNLPLPPIVLMEDYTV